MQTVAFHNLGCKVNGYETDVMVQKLQKKGYTIVSFDKKADIYIINTCTVTNIADRKSRQMLHRAKKMNPDALVVAVGCYVETDPEEVKKDPAIDLAIGNNRKGEIVELIEDWLRKKQEAVQQSGAGSPGDLQSGKEEIHPDKTLGGRTMEDLTDHPVFESMLLTAPEHTRAYIKIQDGCNQFCTYCIIPYARGRVRSREQAEIITEIEGLAAQGTREAVITGIHIGSYGTDRGSRELAELLEKINAVPGIERIRLGSLEPGTMDEAFLQRIASCEKICPHFHLSLQSGSDTILRKMNRHYTAQDFLECTERVRRYYDRPALTTDVIVGFPGETEELFRETVRFLEKAGFYEIHIFKYSPRHGTPAAGMPDQIPEPVKALRSDVLQKLTCRQSEEYRSSFTGQQGEILVEEILTYEEMLRRTQNEMSAVKAAGSAVSSADTPGMKYLTGHTERYVGAAIPYTGEKTAPAVGSPVRGIFAAPVPGTPWLEMIELHDKIG